MRTLESLPDDWEVWSQEEAGRVVLAFRPDVFDGSSFDAACLPTIAVAPGASPDQPPERRARSGSWYVALYLEPTVRARDLDASFESRAPAIDAAVDIAARFVAGEIDYRTVYQVPRPDYFEALDDLVGERAR